VSKEALPERDLFGARPHEYALPPDCWTGKCRSCGAAMAFVTTANGKAMPLSLATCEERDGVKYALPHFVDCPQSKEWSGKK
jgi:hypothetical protein